MKQHWFSCALVLGVGSLITIDWPAALAEEPKLPDAKADLAEGSRLFAQGDYAGALAQFTAAHDASANPKLFFNIAQTELALNRRIEAANAFSAFLDETLEAGDIARPRQTARERLLVLSSQLGRLEVEVTPPQAEVRVGAMVLPPRSHASYVEPGGVDLSVTAPGYQEHVEHLEVRKAENRRLTIQLDPVSLPPPPAPVPDLAPRSASPSPEAAATIALSAPTPAPRPLVPWLLLGGGAVAIGAGAIFGVEASVANSQLDQLVNGDSTQYQPRDAPDLRGRVGVDSWVSTAAIGAGVVSAGIGALLLWLQADQRSTSPVPEDSNAAVARP